MFPLLGRLGDPVGARARADIRGVRMREKLLDLACHLDSCVPVDLGAPSRRKQRRTSGECVATQLMFSTNEGERERERERERKRERGGTSLINAARAAPLSRVSAAKPKGSLKEPNLDQSGPVHHSRTLCGDSEGIGRARPTLVLGHARVARKIGVVPLPGRVLRDEGGRMKNMLFLLCWPRGGFQTQT